MKTQTKNVYERHLRAFLAWCATQSIDAVTASPATVVTYFLKVMSETPGKGTIGQLSAALDRWFLEQGHDLPPTRSESVAVIRRKAIRGPGSIPFVSAEIAQLMNACPRTMIGLRDRALIAWVFNVGARRSAVVSLTVEDYRASGQHIPEVSDWLVAAGIGAGPVFRSVTKGGRVGVLECEITPHSVSLIIKKAATQAGIDPGFCSAESLRGARLHLDSPVRIIKKRATQAGINTALFNITCLKAALNEAVQ